MAQRPSTVTAGSPNQQPRRPTALWAEGGGQGARPPARRCTDSWQPPRDVRSRRRGWHASTPRVLGAFPWPPRGAAVPSLCHSPQQPLGRAAAAAALVAARRRCQATTSAALPPPTPGGDTYPKNVSDRGPAGGG